MRNSSATGSFSRFLGLCFLLCLLLTACASGEVHAVGKIPAPAATPTATANQAATPVSIPATATVVPTASPATAVVATRLTCGETAGSLERGFIDTSLLVRPLIFNVYLPPCYHFDLKTRYPVLYLLHGQGFTEDQWIRLGAPTSADQLITSRQIPPFIMVLPLDPSLKQPTEYNFEEVFTQRLIPTIDGSYRTLATTASRAVGGISRGGAWALHLGLNNPNLFGSIGGHSASIFYSDENALEHILLTVPAAQLPRIWLDAGDRDVELPLIVPFEAFLTGHDIPHEWHEYVGSHDEKYWSAHVDEYLEWYAQDWK